MGANEKAQYQSMIKLLMDSEDPRTHGNFKKTLGCYTYRLTSSWRVTYDIDYSNQIIQILNIDDHKGIYGKD